MSELDPWALDSKPKETAKKSTGSKKSKQGREKDGNGHQPEMKTDTEITSMTNKFNSKNDRQLERFDHGPGRNNDRGL
jgi:hypothetical protein